MKYIFPILIFLILAIPPSDCLIPLLVPMFFIYMVGLMQSFWHYCLLQSTPIRTPGKSPLQVQCVWTWIAANGFAAPERITDTELYLTRWSWGACILHL